MSGSRVGAVSDWEECLGIGMRMGARDSGFGAEGNGAALDLCAQWDVNWLLWPPTASGAYFERLAG